jgi:folate-binding protein YgfZ
VSAGPTVSAVRCGAGLFRLGDRGLIAVEGGDRARWLDGMVSNDVASLAEGPETSGCYATLLTRQGRIVSDLHVLWRPDALWLELAAEATAAVIAHLEKFIVADDVRLVDRSASIARLAIEGPAAPGILARTLAAPLGLGQDACAEVSLADGAWLVARFGWSGGPGFQLFGNPETAEAGCDALMQAGGSLGLVEADSIALETLRIEAGVPRFGSELDESVLPPEARLERAISTTKGCYTGQEVISRIASQGKVGHILVGLSSEGDETLAPGAAVEKGGRKVGEVTSSCRSPSHGSIALAFVRRSHDAPGTSLEVAGRPVRVSELPFPAADARESGGSAAG